MPPCLRLSAIRKRFGATLALAGVDLEVAPGEIHALVGENGAGKSTLMKILSGVMTPDAGTITLNGEPFQPREPGEARRRGVVMVNQELAIAPHLSVSENIVLGAEPCRGPFVRRSAARQSAAAALAQLGRPDLPLDVPAGQLGIAEQQLVEIARAVALGCNVLILDEPTSSLTQADAQRLFQLMRRLRDQGKAVIYISHFLDDVQALSDRYTVLRDGASVATGRTADITPGELVRLMVGRTVDELYARTKRTPGEILLELEKIGGSPKPVSASLQLRRGEVLGLAGLVGAGRSELLRLIFALDPVRTGSVRVGTYAGPGSPLLRWQQGVGFLSEDRKGEGLALDLSLEHNLTLPGLPAFIRPDRLGRDAQGWIDRLGVRCTGAGQAVGALSGGNQQKVALGRLLRNGADVLLLDEPTRGVDIGAKQTVYRLVDELASAGKAVLMVSSYLPELIGMSDRIAVMSYRGILSPALPTSDWTESRIMLAATGAAAA